MENVLNKVGEICTGVVGKILLAILVFIIGRIVIKHILKLAKKIHSIEKLDPNVQTIFYSVIKYGLYVLLVVSIVGILGVPLASITAVVAASAATIGLALQGALSNVAAGIQILVFRPYAIGDYISAAGVEGIVKNISIFFTTLTTLDNKRVVVPNATAIGGTVTNFSAEGTRRVELTFKAPATTDSNLVLNTIAETAKANELVLKGEEAPEEAHALIAGAGDGLKEYIVRAWCKASDYWTVYFGLINQIGGALGDAGVEPGVKRLVIQNKDT